jgi:large subunit ribosomal protein L30e
MAPVKKSKSAKASESINTRLQLVVKSGKVRLQFRMAVA